MPSFIDPELFDNAFLEHPNSSAFLEAAFFAKETCGIARILKNREAELANRYGLSEGEAAALSYLAKNRVNKFSDELEMDIIGLEQRGY
jgi:hypothetical protein